MDRRRSLEDAQHRALGDASLQSGRELELRCAAVKKEEARAMRRHDREIEALRRDLDDLMRHKKGVDASPPASEDFPDDNYATPVVHEARQRVRQLPVTVARAEQQLAAVGATAGANLSVPRLLLDEPLPAGRAKRSMSLPNVPAHIERLSSERMPGPGLSLLGTAFGAAGGPEGHFLQVPGASGPPLRKRSIDFSQLSSLGVIRESE